jgi:hypothetical protein
MLGRNPDQIRAFFACDERFESAAFDPSNRRRYNGLNQAFKFSSWLDCLLQSDLVFARHSVDPFGLTERDALPRLAAVDYFKIERTRNNAVPLRVSCIVGSLDDQCRPTIPHTKGVPVTGAIATDMSGYLVMDDSR